MPTLVDFVSALLAALRKWAPAKTLRRRLLKQGWLVCKASCSTTETWLHISYINLTTFRARVMPLTLDDDFVRIQSATARDLIALRASELPKLGMRTWWQALAPYVSAMEQTSWAISLFRLTRSQSQVGAFLPADVLVEAFSDSVAIWPPPRKRVKQRSERRRPREPTMLAIMDGDFDGAEDPGGDRGGDSVDSDGGDVPPELRPIHDEEEESDASDELDYPSDVEDWAGIDIDYGPEEMDDLPSDDGGEGDGPPDDGLGGADDIPIGPAVADAVPGPPVPPGVPGEHAGADAAAPPRPAFPQLHHPDDLGYIRLSQTLGVEHKDMRAVCFAHKDENCTLSRQCKRSGRAKGRPFGLMYSFLSVAADYPDKHTHKSAMAMAEWAALPVRQEARDRGRLVPGSQEYLDAEAPKLHEEPEEPVNRD
jgi:hypothetical protein